MNDTAPPISADQARAIDASPGRCLRRTWRAVDVLLSRRCLRRVLTSPSGGFAAGVRDPGSGVRIFTTSGQNVIASDPDPGNRIPARVSEASVIFRFH